MSDDINDIELVRQLLSDNPSEDLLDQIASTVVNEMSDSFPELTLNSKRLNVALSDFRKEKLGEVKSKRNYRTKIQYIETYLTEVVEAKTTDELTSEHVEQYSEWRKYDSLEREDPLKDSTLSDDMYLFEEFVEYLIEHRLVPQRFQMAVQHPEINSGDGVDEKRLDPDVAKASLDHLRKYEYASVEHVTMELFCESGPRKGGVFGLDVVDFDADQGVLKFDQLGQQSTPLKKGEESEREITLYGDTVDIIQDYIANVRPPATDSEGRKPLLTKGDGRIGKSTLQKISYKWTRPCKVGLDCPHDRDPEQCDAAQRNNSAYKCPSSRAPHHIRTGYITDQRNQGTSAKAIEHRCDVSPRVQKKHYDLPDSDEKRERFVDEFRDSHDDQEELESGFSH